MHHKINSNINLHGLFAGGVFTGLFVSVTVAVVLTFIPFHSTLAIGGKAYDETNIKSVKDQFADKTKKLEDLSVLYHGTVNDIFNAYIDAFTALDPVTQPGAAALQKKKITPPTDKDANGKSLKDKDGKDITDGGDSQCQATDDASMNLSTYCLYLRVNDLYDSYHNMLVARTNNAVQEVINTLKGNASQESSLQLSNAKKNWIAGELASSKKALDSGLQAYSELLTQYPIHTQYQKTINLLVKYYDHLVDVRKKVDTFPKRFLDVTTANCN